jgi:hypothetical protein
MLDLLRLGPFFRAHTFPVAFPVGFAPCATDSVFFPPLYFWLFLCILGVFFSDFCRLGFWVSLLVFGFVCCFLGGLFGVSSGFWGVCLGCGSFRAGLGVQRGLLLYFGFWVSREFCLGWVGVEAFVSCILCVYYEYTVIYKICTHLSKKKCVILKICLCLGFVE